MTIILLLTGAQLKGQFSGLFSLSLHIYYNLFPTLYNRNTKHYTITLNWLTLNELPLTMNTVPVFDIFAEQTAVI